MAGKKGRSGRKAKPQGVKADEVARRRERAEAGGWLPPRGITPLQRAFWERLRDYVVADDNFHPAHRYLVDEAVTLFGELIRIRDSLQSLSPSDQEYGKCATSYAKLMACLMQQLRALRVVGKERPKGKVASPTESDPIEAFLRGA